MRWLTVVAWCALLAGGVALFIGFQYYRSMPLTVFHADGATVPFSFSRAQAYAFAKESALLFGGIPPKARLAGVYAMQMQYEDARFNRSETKDINFVWRPTDSADPGEYFSIDVAAVPTEDCFKYGHFRLPRCSDVTFHFRMRTQAVMRHWPLAWPWYSERDRVTTRLTGSPRHITSYCPNKQYDFERAMQILAGSVYAGPLSFPHSTVIRAMRRFGGIIAEWPGLTLDIQHSKQVYAMQHIVVSGDMIAVPDNGAFDARMIYVHDPKNGCMSWQKSCQRDSWIAVLDRNNAPVCTAHPYQDAVLDAYIYKRSSPTLADVRSDALVRAQEESWVREGSYQNRLRVDAVTLNGGKIGTVDVQVVTVDKTGRWASDYYYDASSGFIEYEHVRRIS